MIVIDRVTFDDGTTWLLGQEKRNSHHSNIANQGSNLKFENTAFSNSSQIKFENAVFSYPRKAKKQQLCYYQTPMGDGLCFVDEYVCVWHPLNFVEDTWGAVEVSFNMMDVCIREENGYELECSFVYDQKSIIADCEDCDMEFCGEGEYWCVSLCECVGIDLRINN